MATATETKPTYFRASVSRGLSNTHAVERDGGDYGAGIIRGASLITRGEALGHGAWVDKVMVLQTVEKTNQTANGLKVRFAHPNLSSDGLGKLTARAKNARLSQDGNQAFADLHIVESSRNTPDGDLGEYVMQLAEQDADMFGTSIVFQGDTDAENEFLDNNAIEVDGKYTFISPDTLNENGLPHCRIAELRACDIVDEPAANPEGLFHREDLAGKATELIEYCFGARDEAESFQGIHPDRAKQFLNRFLENHDMEVINKMATNETPEVVDVYQDRKTAAAIYVEQFGAELGTAYFCDGLTLDDARKEYSVHQFAEKDARIEALENQVAVLQEEKAGLESKLKAAEVAGEQEAFDTGETHDQSDDSKYRAVRKRA